jgi:hypothetical protein
VNSCNKLIFLLWICIRATFIQAQERTIPGPVTSPYPTILNLAVEWLIQGDDNQNGIVTVQFREKGQTLWKQGMPLFRVPAGKNIGFTWANKHSGSIFDLRPGTEYEIKLALTDPDGGSAEETLFSRTRRVPEIGDNAEIIEIKPGRYDTLRTKSGTPDRPVAYICSGGEAIFTHIDLNNRQWVYIQGLIVDNRNEEGIGIRMNGAENCAVMNCTLNSPYGIVADKPGATNCYISDNVVTGICVWTSEAMGSNGDNIGEGIQMTGPGNVICYNRVTGFRDCISTMEDQRTFNQTCIDIYNNDVFRGVDDAIEADFCFSNCRIFRNRITNCYMGLSSQPGLGGPNYFVRNVMYNIINGGLKLQRYSQGDVILHNTMIKIGRGLGGNTSMDYEYFRNNLAIGGPIPEKEWGKYGVGKPYAADIQKPGDHSSFDYDAVGVYGTPYKAMIGNKAFSEVEKHGIEKITMVETFNKIEFPNPPAPEREVPNLRPNASSRVIDGGVVIPNINDNYTGEAPDCGAYEYGQKLPHYGPRTYAIQNATLPGELSSPFPTLMNLGIEWLIEGDENQNGVVTVQFREKGSTVWKQGMPLFRVPAGEKLGFSWKNKFAGSIFNLKPDTPYEIKLNLTDPDGGAAEKLLEARTRPEPRIGPGAEIIEIQPGRYDTLKTKSGNAEKPVVYQCSKGEATFTHIDMVGKQWVYINGLKVINPGDTGIAIRMNGAANCMVSRCEIHSMWGIVAYLPGAENCYICDNVISGMNEWNNKSMGAHGDNVGEGIEMTGPGNVICYNRVTGFRDCISTMEDQHAVNQTGIDIYNNEINLGLDDGIEADFCFSNCRIFCNRLTNCFVGLSSQPGLGGPNYFFRNSMYNIIYGGYKLRRFSEGDVVMHNSIVKVGSGMGGNDSMDFAFFRNNVAIGGPTGGVNWGDYGSGKPCGASIFKPGSHCSFDYDAVGVFGVPYEARIGKQPFSAVEKHGIENISLEETFQNIQFPDPPVPAREKQDLRPSQGARIIDAALLIPNINDNYTGSAPDCGAYEYGQVLPHYGPRE